jgi:hypothetical protein
MISGRNVFEDMRKRDIVFAASGFRLSLFRLFIRGFRR